MTEDIITQVITAGAKKLEEITATFLEDPKRLDRFNLDIRESVLQMGVEYVGNVLTMMNQSLKDNTVRRVKGWNIVRDDSKTLTTSLGDVTFTKTLFISKATGERCYLMDRFLGLTPNERLTEDAEASLLAEAVESSYRKGGEQASILSQVSKQTVMKKIHELEFPREQDRPDPETKKVVKTLFIDADEDHVALQFNEKRGDLQKNQQGYKINTLTAKLVYVYEGVEPEKEGSKRNHLIGAHYFSGEYSGKGNAELWNEVFTYVEKTYDLEQVERIYLNGDGGAWIQAAPKYFAGLTVSLDEFHMRKYILKMTRHLKDSREDAAEQVYKIIKNGTKKDFEELAEEYKQYSEDTRVQARIDEGKTYILNNWSAARVRLTHRKTEAGCSAEGHVSHVLSSRMSSRPMGWSHQGADRMAHLRAYYYNKGDMLELVRSQPEVKRLRAVAGAEDEEIFSASQMLYWERTNAKKDGRYYDQLQGTISDQLMKKLGFRRAADRLSWTLSRN